MSHLSSTKIIEHLTKSLSTLRTGVVNASILDHVFVEAYGSKLKIQEVATVNKPEPAQLLITPFDKGLNSAIEKAISDSNIGVNPINDGAGIRLNFPPLTEENRKIRVKEVNKMLEESRIVVRNERQDIMKKWKNEKEASELSEDELKRLENELQKEVEKCNEELDRISKQKEDELMKL